MDLQNFWVGIGIQMGGSLGFGATSTEGVLFNGAELLSLSNTPRKSLRYVEIAQTTYSGMIGISFGGSHDPALILGRVNRDVTEFNRSSDYSQEWELSISIGVLNRTIGHSIALLGKIDRSIARVAGVSYAFATKLSRIVDKMQTSLDILGLIGLPPSLKVFPIPVTPLSFEFDVGRKVELTTTRVMSSGTLTP